MAAGRAPTIDCLAQQEGVVLPLTRKPDSPVNETATRARAAHGPQLFKGFERKTIEVPGAAINVVYGGAGEPLLLLHGYPQTHVMWRGVAPRLAQDFTVVMPDLRGYGDSSKPAGGEDHRGYAKRAMARDQVEVMARLGFDRFAVVGHNRGGRVGYRLALDHPDKVTRLAVLDIVPTRKVYASVGRQLATDYYHWFFLIQPAPFPEIMIEHSVEFYLRDKWFKGLIPVAISEAAYAEYLRCFRDPATIHASCEDYRAAASIDLAHDEADIQRKLACPVLALWGANGAMHALYDVAAAWRERAENVSAKAVHAGHFLVEQAPEETLAALQVFLGGHDRVSTDGK
jgi:haloacetate dehalogenase